MSRDLFQSSDVVLTVVVEIATSDRLLWKKEHRKNVNHRESDTILQQFLLEAHSLPVATLLDSAQLNSLRNLIKKLNVDVS